MKLALIAVCVATLALAACRREVPSYEPMKLGGAVSDQARN